MTSPCARWPSAPASRPKSARIQAERAAELPALREAEARAAAGLQRLTTARDMLDREEERAKERVAELDRRLTQFAADIAREQQQASDADIALARLDTEDAELKEEIKSRVEKRSGVDERVADAEATLENTEQLFAELTTALADLTAKRNQFEANVRSHRDRLARLDQDIANVQADERKLAEETGGLGDIAALAGAMESAQQHRAECEATVQESEAAQVAARAKLEASRAPLAEADKRVQRLETEARTISKMVNGETKNLWPPIIDGVTVAKGYEKALGAALGDDLDAPVDPSAPMRWTVAGNDAGDPSLPSGRRAARGPCAGAAGADASPEADRRGGRRSAAPSWYRSSRPASGWSRPKATSGAGTALLPPRMRRPAPPAASPSARASIDIEHELEQARLDATAKRQALETADAEVKAAAPAESAAREASRAAQREADAARERHAATEREINRHAARKSALFEAYSRLSIDRTEVEGAHQAANDALAELPPSVETETKLAAVRSDIETHRRMAAQVRAEAQALGPRGRARRPPRAGDPRRAQGMGQPQGHRAPRRSRPSRPASPRSPRSVSSSRTRRRYLRRSAAR